MEGLSRVKFKNVEAQANSQENQSLLLFSRLQNSAIKEQLINLYLKDEEIHHKEGDVTVEVGEDGKFKKDLNGELLFIKKEYIPKTKEEIEEEYKEALNRITNLTYIDYEKESSIGGIGKSGAEIIHLGLEFPNGKPTPMQWSIIEAHEKGHTMRQFHGRFFDEYFSSGFNFQAVNITNQDYLWYLQVSRKKEKNEEQVSFEAYKKQIIGYLSSAPEIAERMSQLKNYFGMSANEMFTPEHLKYARCHYEKDTGMSFDMHLFFEAITPETESEFLRLINTSGI